MRMKLPISPLAWLLGVNIIYLIAGMINVFVYRFTETEYIQMVWVIILGLPLYFPMQRFINVDPFWKIR